MHKALQYIALLFSISFTEPGTLLLPLELYGEAVTFVLINCANGISIDAIWPLPSRLATGLLILLPWPGL